MIGAAIEAAANSLQLDASAAARLAVAGLAGLAVGIERERSGHTSGRDARFAGVRTFLLLGVLGGLAGWIIDGGLLSLGIVLVAGASALTIAAYVIAARRRPESIDSTTEVAALVVIALGVVSGLGLPLVTSAIAAIMVLALAEKTRIHEWVKRLGEREFSAALQFAVLALVILPLLPEGPYGPYDSIRPRSLWTVVLLFSALNFVGYLASRTLGTHRGYALTGLLGGLVSSTLVTWQFSHQSRRTPTANRALAVGVIGACTVLIVRVAILSAALNAAVAAALVPYLLPVLVAGAGALALAYRWHRGATDAESPTEPRNPLGLWSAIKMTLAFQLVLSLLPLVQELWGAGGVIASAAVLGLTDMDALTYSMTRLKDGADAVALGARAIAVGVLANTGLKLAVALFVGNGEFRRVTGLGLVALGAASSIGMWIAS